MEVLLVLKNVTFEVRGKPFVFYQEFEVNFYWVNHTLNFSSSLSGNPGYKLEKPVLIGSLVSMLNITNITGTNLTESKTYYKVYRNPVDVTKNFMLFPTNEKGYCKLNNNSYSSVAFGFNYIFKCTFSGSVNISNNVSNSCRDIQKHILEKWSVIYNTSFNSSLVVGRFGNADANNAGEWLKVLYNKAPVAVFNSTTGVYGDRNGSVLCQNLISSLSVNIFHSRVDTKYYSNQEKIVGVMYNFGSANNLSFELVEGRLVFAVPARVDVVFVDITKPKVRKFVDPPTFKVRLPYDFFYPFIKVYNGANHFHDVSSVLMTCVFLLFVLTQ